MRDTALTGAVHPTRAHYSPLGKLWEQFFQIRPDSNCMFRAHGNDRWLRRALEPSGAHRQRPRAAWSNCCQQVIENVQAVLFN